MHLLKLERFLGLMIRIHIQMYMYLTCIHNIYMYVYIHVFIALKNNSGSYTVASMSSYCISCRVNFMSIIQFRMFFSYNLCNVGENIIKISS